MATASTEQLYAKAEGDEEGSSAKPTGWHGSHRGLGAPGLQRGGTAPTWWVGVSLQDAVAVLAHWVLFFCSPGICCNNLVRSNTHVLALANLLCLWCGFFQTSQTPVGGDSSAPSQFPVGGKQGCWPREEALSPGLRTTYRRT